MPGKCSFCTQRGHNRSSCLIRKASLVSQLKEEMVRREQRIRELEIALAAGADAKAQLEIENAKLKAISDLKKEIRIAAQSPLIKAISPITSVIVGILTFMTQHYHLIPHADVWITVVLSLAVGLLLFIFGNHVRRWFA